MEKAGGGGGREGEVERVKGRGWRGEGEGGTERAGRRRKIKMEAVRCKGGVGGKQSHSTGRVVTDSCICDGISGLGGDPIAWMRPWVSGQCSLSRGGWIKWLPQGGVGIWIHHEGGRVVFEAVKLLDPTITSQGGGMDWGVEGDMEKVKQRG
eukprot:760955-Hanusia_phi.AAC.8